MALFSICSICGKKKLGILVDADGICSACETKILEQRRKEEKQNTVTQSDKFDVSSFVAPSANGYTPPPAQDGPVYVVIDVETTGLSPTKDTIVQVSALRFFGKKAIDGLNSYVNPLRPIPAESTAIHGITDEKVKDSPTIDKIKEPFMNLIKGAILVGHNAIFDLNFLDYAFHGALDGVEYIDTMWVAKTLLSLPNYRLETVADYAEFHPEQGYHDSLTDCTATAAAFFRLGFDMPEFSKTYHSKGFVKANHSFTPKDIVPPAIPTDSSHPLYGKKIVFTGELSVDRHKAAQMAVDVGAIVRTSVSSKTDYLVVGEQDTAIVGEDGMSGREEKAHELNALGKASIEIIDEYQFMSLLEGVRSLDSQITFTGFEPPEYHEKEFLATIESDFRSAVEDMGGDSQLMKISVTSSYTAVMFGNLTAFRLRIRGKQRYISIPLSLADLISENVPSKKPTKNEKYYRVLISAEYPLESYIPFLVNVVSETVNRYPKEWDCCSRYMECSDAKTCVHPDKSFALGCGYRKTLSSGRIFYGKNRNI